MMRWKFTLPELEEKLGCLAEGAVEPLARGGEMSARGGEMSDREARAQHGTADPIEQKQAAGRFVIELYGQMPPKSLADPPSSQPFAFQVQERYLVQCIRRP